MQFSFIHAFLIIIEVSVVSNTFMLTILLFEYLNKPFKSYFYKKIMYALYLSYFIPLFL